MKFRLVENYLFESKEDEQRFINKFGEDRLNSFKKQHSNIVKKWDTKHGDMTWVVANLDTYLLDRVLSTTRNTSDKEQSELDEIINSEEAKKAKKIYDKDGFEIYKIMSVAASVKFGLVVGGKSKWCTSGGYFDGKKNGGIYKEAEYYYNKYLREKYDGYYICFAPNHKKYNISLLKEPIGTKISDVWEGESDAEVGIIPGLNENITDPDTGVIIYTKGKNEFMEQLLEVLADKFSIKRDEISIGYVDNPDEGMEVIIDGRYYTIFNNEGELHAFKCVFKDLYLDKFLGNYLQQVRKTHTHTHPEYIINNTNMDKCKALVQERINEFYGYFINKNFILNKISSQFKPGDNIDGIILTQDILDGQVDDRVIKRFRDYLINTEINSIDDYFDYWIHNLAMGSADFKNILNIEQMLVDIYINNPGSYKHILGDGKSEPESIIVNNQELTIYKQKYFR